MKNVFKLWFIALAVIIVRPAFAQTEVDFVVDLTKDESGVVIKGYTGKQTAITIPAKIQGYPVKEIGTNAFGTEDVKRYILDNDIFDENRYLLIKSGTDTQLTSVTIPVGVITICDFAFSSQSRLTSVIIPASVTLIEDLAFAWCKSLATVNLSEGLIEIESQAFSGCSALKTIKLPNSLTKLGGGAFSESGITAINIPASVTSIGSYAFDNCKSLATVNLSEGLIEIGWQAFERCSALKTIKLPNSLISLGGKVFSESGLTSITLGTGMKEIPDNAFSYIKTQYGGTKFDDNYYGLPIKTIVIPEGVTKIGKRAFMNCTELTSVTLPSTLKEIEDYAFNGCSALTTVTIPATLVKIGREAFSGCIALTTVTIPATLTSVQFGNNVFTGCNKLLLATRSALKKIGWDGILATEDTSTTEKRQILDGK